MRSKKAPAIGVAAALLLTGSGGVAAQAVTTGGGGVSLTTARTVDSEVVELQRVRASVRSKGRVVKRAAPLLVTAEVPGEVTAVVKKKRLGLPTWRVVVEMESGYKVAAFVHRRTGVIIDWAVLAVPDDVDYTPPKKDPKAPKPDPTKPKPAPLPEVLEDAIEEERGTVTPAAADPTIPVGPGSPTVIPDDDDSDDDSRDSADDGDDRDDDRDEREDSREDDREEQRESSDDGDDRDEDRDDDRRDDSRDDSQDDDDRGDDRGDDSDDSRDDGSDDRDDDRDDDDD